MPDAPAADAAGVMLPDPRTPAAAALEDRVRGLVLGCAIGDAVGLATEFMSRKEAEAAYGGVLAERKAAGEDPPYLRYADIVQDDHRRKWVRGGWTDDTASVALILRLLVAGGGEGLADPAPADFAAALLRWHHGGFPELGETGGRGMGHTIARLVDDPEFLRDPAAVARRAWEGTGRAVAPNGAVMRTAPLALLALRGGAEEGLRHCADAVRRIACSTHFDPRSTAACGAVTAAAALLLRGAGGGPPDAEAITSAALREGLALLQDEAQLGPPPPPLWPCPACTIENPAAAAECSMCGGARPADASQLRHNVGFGVAWSDEEHRAARYDAARAAEELRSSMLCRDLGELDLDDRKRIGYCMKAVGCCFWGLRTYCAEVARGGAAAAPGAVRRVLQAVTMAAGDADTNGAVAGAVLGAAAGAAGLPADWRDGLAHRAFLDDLAGAAARRAAHDASAR